MSFEEKRNWVFLVATAIAYVVYVAIILGRARGIPITEVPYAWPLIGSIGLAIVASIAGSILAAMSAPTEADKKDERDARIHRYGEVIGYTTSSIGIVGALGLTMAEAAHFWIGNAIYLSFVLAAQVSTAMKLVAYRRGLPSW